jgi:hypothetical protein
MRIHDSGCAELKSWQGTNYPDRILLCFSRYLAIQYLNYPMTGSFEILFMLSVILPLNAIFSGYWKDGKRNLLNTQQRRSANHLIRSCTRRNKVKEMPRITSTMKSAVLRLVTPCNLEGT